MHSECLCFLATGATCCVEFGYFEEGWGVVVAGFEDGDGMVVGMMGSVFYLGEGWRNRVRAWEWG